MTQHVAHTVRDELEAGAGLRIFGLVEKGDTLAIEMAGNSRIAATVKSITPGRLWLEIAGSAIAFDAGSDESDALPSSPLAFTDWTQI